MMATSDMVTAKESSQYVDQASDAPQVGVRTKTSGRFANRHTRKKNYTHQPPQFPTSSEVTDVKDDSTVNPQNTKNYKIERRPHTTSRYDRRGHKGSPASADDNWRDSGQKMSTAQTYGHPHQRSEGQLFAEQHVHHHHKKLSLPDRKKHPAQTDHKKHSLKPEKVQSAEPTGKSTGKLREPVEALKSNLNVEAKAFVPERFRHYQTKNEMTKLGKVGPRMRRNKTTDSAKGRQHNSQRDTPASAESDNHSRDLKQTEKSDAIDLVRSFTSSSAPISGNSKPNGVADKDAVSNTTNNKHDNEGHSCDTIEQAAGSGFALKQRQKMNRSSADVVDSEEKLTERAQTKETTAAFEKEKQKAANARNQILLSFQESKPLNPITIESQREALIETLVNATYECTICYNGIRQDTATWNCAHCYHVFHLYCVKKWANTLVAQDTDRQRWRCPTCQHEYANIPNQYKCFCEKLREPVWNGEDTPHSCGEVCGRSRTENCKHPCNELCHPGPCPPCNAFISKHCNCGRSYQKVKCRKQTDVRCSLPCNKQRNCGRHKCEVVCHSGPCPECDELIHQDCFCGEATRSIVCGPSVAENSSYCCGKLCGKPLKCGNHNCQLTCHTGDCPPCKTSPDVVTTCHCGRTSLAELKGVERKSCLDEIPTCGKLCGKVLSCGDSGTTHYCKRTCHDGDCSCTLTTEITCRCKNKVQNMLCEEAKKYTDTNPYLCEKKCNKKRECGRHKCGLPCCVLESHPCFQICSKRLTCGKHKCEELCHRGNCPTCWHVSFDELRCHCGVSVIYPPVACGTKPPACKEICSRVHTCEHPVQHSCHSEDSCPPCVVLTTKPCMGNHEKRNNIPCHMKDLSCGKPCHKPLSCGDHKCMKTCHKGECGEQSCTQPCPKTRTQCGHPCLAPCHPGTDCPPTDCHHKVLLKCQCGHRKEEVLCYMTSKRLPLAALTLKMKELSTTVDVSELMSSMNKKELDCNEECAQLERNRRLASALDIVNPELLSDLAAPQFSDFLKSTARSNLQLISQIEKALHDLVKSAQESKQEMRCHSFPSMKREHRQAVHELAEFYGCSTVSYDEEPQKNVVAMAYKSKCCLPKQSLTSFIKSEKYPRPPMPIPVAVNVHQLRLKNEQERLSTHVKPEENNVIDYFEMTS